MDHNKLLKKIANEKFKLIGRVSDGRARQTLLKIVSGETKIGKNPTFELRIILH